MLSLTAVLGLGHRGNKHLFYNVGVLKSRVISEVNGCLIIFSEDGIKVSAFVLVV